MKLPVKIYSLLLSLLIVFPSIRAASLENMVKPLEDLVNQGENIPLGELPVIEKVPSELKSLLNNVVLMAPRLAIDVKTQSAVLSAGAEIAGFPVIVKLRLARGELGAAAGKPVFLTQVKDKKKAEEELEKVAENTKKAASGWKKGELPTREVLSGPKIGTYKQMAPQREVEIPVKQTSAVKKNVSQAKNKVASLSKGAADRVKEGAGKAKAKITPAAKKVFNILKFALFVGVPDDINFASINKNLAFLDIIEFTNRAFVITTGDFYDKEWDRTFYKGLNLVSTARLAGPLDKINGIIGQNLTEITLHGVILPGVFGSSVTAELPGKIQMGEYLETSGLLLRVQLVQAAVPVSVSILTGLNVKLPSQDQPLAFRTGLTYMPPTELIIGGWMEGMWKNPFSLPYFSIGEVGIQAGLDINTAAASLGVLSLSRIGLRGKMGFADKSIEMAASISLSSASPDILLYGKFEGGLYLKDIVNVGTEFIEGAAKMGGEKINLDKAKNVVPNLGIKNAEIMIAPKDVSLAGRYFRQGVKVNGAIEILGETGEINFEFSKERKMITGLAYMSEINAGPFTITGAGKDKKRGNEDDGPILNFSLKTVVPFAQLFMDARVELDKKILGGAYGDTRINFSLKGIEFWFKTQLFNQFLMHLEMSAPNVLKPKDWKVIGNMEQEGLDNFAKVLKQAAEIISERAKKDIAKAQKNLDDAKKKLDDLSKERKEIENENEANVKRALSGMKKKLASLQKEKDQLENQIRKCAGKVPREAQEAVKKKAEEIRGELTAKDIRQQLNNLKKRGLNKKQLDRIAQNLWARLADRELDRSRDVANQLARKPSLLQGLDPKTRAVVQQAIEKRGSKRIADVASIFEGQIEWMIDKLRKMGMPKRYETPVREDIWKNQLHTYWWLIKNYQKVLAKQYKFKDIITFADKYFYALRNMDLKRKVGYSPEAVKLRMQNIRDLMAEALFSVEVSRRRICKDQWKTMEDCKERMDNYVDKRWIKTDPKRPGKYQELIEKRMKNQPEYKKKLMKQRRMQQDILKKLRAEGKIK